MNVAQTTAIEKSKNIADLISNNIVDEITNYEGNFIEAAANDNVVSKPSVIFTTIAASRLERIASHGACKCGNEGITVPTREGRIIGGKEPIYEKTYPKYRHSWPFIVKLGIVFPSSYWFSGPEYSKGGTCGGTVLNNRNRSQI